MSFLGLDNCPLITVSCLLQSLSHCELITDEGIRHLGCSPCATESMSFLGLDNCPLITVSIVTESVPLRTDHRRRYPSPWLQSVRHRVDVVPRSTQLSPHHCLYCLLQSLSHCSSSQTKVSVTLAAVRAPQSRCRSSD